MTTNNGGPGYRQFLTFQQSFTYDNLNRLQMASENGGWSRTYNYDQYGNQWVTNPSVIAPNGLRPSANVYNGNNQINATFDAAGNQTVFGTYGLSYDAENRQIGAADNQGTQVHYGYDGNGQRVIKNNTVYVYDAFGSLTAEYNNAPAQYAPCATCYVSADYLGSTRLVTDSQHLVIARHDYLPFGEEIPANTSGRRSEWGPGGDNVAQKFTGQERDNETAPALDFFQTRYFSGAQARFNSPDPGNVRADLTNPQSWNAYAYVWGNPLSNIDPSGMDCVTFEDGSTGDDGQARRVRDRRLPKSTM